MLHSEKSSMCVKLFAFAEEQILKSQIFDASFIAFADQDPTSA